MGVRAAFVSAGGYHHHIGLNTRESLGGSPPAPGHDRALPSGDSLPDARSARRCLATSVSGGHRAPPPTTASAKRSTCATPTTMEWNYIGTGRKSFGRARPMVNWRCSHVIWTCKTCSQRRSTEGYLNTSQATRGRSAQANPGRDTVLSVPFIFFGARKRRITGLTLSSRAPRPPRLARTPIPPKKSGALGTTPGQRPSRQ